MLSDDNLAEAAVTKGIQRSARFSWDATARRIFEAYEQAIDHRRRCASV
jgi:glycogen synthase